MQKLHVIVQVPFYRLGHLAVQGHAEKAGVRSTPNTACSTPWAPQSSL